MGPRSAFFEIDRIVISGWINARDGSDAMQNLFEIYLKSSQHKSWRTKLKRA